jgi:CheY-like chemotaxis protein/HPt (histidine-containing phosphotransfer) domain-containing protein
MVKLELDIVEETGDTIYLSFIVADTGIGMRQDVVGKLFKPFTQADSSTTRKFGGTGLGLVISQRLVELLGGKLKVSSREGAGSRFYFTLSLPIVQQGDVPKVSPFGSAWTIWVVEDDQKMRDHWSYMFESLGLSVIAFDSWHAALERLRRAGKGVLPQFLLMDMEMPDMYGTETWNEFRTEAEKAGAKIIALTTTFGRDELQKLAPEERPIAILTKPATRGAIVRVLGEAFRNLSAGPQSMAHRDKKPVGHEAKDLNIRILLAEDNKINQLVAVEMLQNNGYEVGLAVNGEETLQLLEKQPWDLILMDIHMPVMDGTEAVRCIRSRKKYDAIPIIAVTANVLKKDHDQYLNLGMNDVLTKPLSEELMLEKLAYWLGGREQLPDLYDKAVETKRPRQLRLSAGEQEGQLSPVAGMDIESALERVNGKSQILVHMMEQFRLDYAEFMDRLRMMLKQGDEETALRMLHTLKGASGYLSATELCLAASQVSGQLKIENKDAKELQLAIAHLEKEMATLLAGIEAARPKFDN